MGHGTTNSNTLAGLAPEQERDTIRTVLKTIEQATGKRPRGWLGSGLVETYNTLDILAEEGVQYCGDWNNDVARKRHCSRLRRAIASAAFLSDRCPTASVGLSRIG